MRETTFKPGYIQRASPNPALSTLNPKADGAGGGAGADANPSREKEREFFIDNLPVRIHLIIEMILVDRPCVMGV